VSQQEFSSLEEIFSARRDTRHFTNEAVPDKVIQKALRAGHAAPSVGLTDATRYYLVRTQEVKQAIKKLFHQYNKKALGQIKDEAQKKSYAALKLEAITEAPLGLVVCYDRSVMNTFTIGTVASNETLKFSAVCAVQNIWLSLTEQGYSMGWVSILNYYQFKKILGLPEEVEPLGYFCIGKPATDYDKQPMLQQVGWKNKSDGPLVREISTLTPDVEASYQAQKNSGSNDQSLLNKLQYIIDHKTKPLGALGVLEKLALQIGMVLKSTRPQLNKPHLLVFAADHGIAQHGVSAYPQEVTSQMVTNFIEGGAAINVFCQQHGIALSIVDAGVNYDFAPHLPIINNKVGKGTASFLTGPAMTLSQVHTCLLKGEDVVKAIHLDGCNIIGFGEMGIGNTSTASVLMSLLCDIPLEQCIGKGTGINNEQLNHKHRILNQAIDQHQGDRDLFAILTYFGGFEIIQMAGAMLAARKNGMLLLVDGFICTVAFLCAYLIDPEVKQNAVFSHQSEEQGHRLLLEKLDAQPLLNLGLRLGEGTGCALAYPVLQSAVAFLNDMASFEEAGVSNKM
jgi:nicotinate-nucleotide--dimethylbenzimidazole phosphoribosyltransferase